MSREWKQNAADTLHGIDLFLPPIFRIALIFISGIWAWALNLYFLSLNHIDAPGLIKYSNRSSHDQPHYHRTFRLASTATGMFGLSLLLFWLTTRGQSDSVLQWEVIPQFYMFLLFLLFVLPFRRFSRAGRYHFLSTLKRVSVGGLAEHQGIKFGDILLADVLTSYAKVLGDLVAIFCTLLFRDISSNAPLDRSCGSSLLVPAIVSIPSFIRLRQCLIEYNRTRKSQDHSSGWGGQHLANAFKYSTALPIIVLGVLQKNTAASTNGYGEILNRWWIVAMLLNSSFSFYWDVAKDWDLSLFTKERLSSQYPWALRSRLYFRPHSLYYLAMMNDLLLRFVWVLRILPHYDRFFSTEGGIFISEILEIFRRWVWIFFRAETELVRSRPPPDASLPLSEFEH